MFDSLSKSFRAYTSNPVGFSLNSLFLILYQVLVVLVVAGLWFIFFFVASIFYLPADSPIFLVFDALLLVLLFYFSAGVKGAYVWSCNEILEGRRASMLDFFRYIRGNAGTFFFLTLLKYFFTALFTVPLILLYLYVLVDYEVQYLDALIYLTAAFLAFIIHFLFFPSIVSAATYGSSISRSLRLGFRMIKKKNILALGLYILYAFVWILNYIPLVQILSLFVLYPIVYSAMIVMFKDAVPVNEQIEKKGVKKK